MSSPRFMSRALPLAAVALLVLNDHMLKHAFPGFVTGKVSDFAGLFFFPLFLSDAAALLVRRRALVLACVATALVFTLAKVTNVGHEVYCVGLGLLQWPFRALAAVLRDGHVPSSARVRMAMDATDLFALVNVLGAYVYAARSLRSTGTAPRFDAGALRVPGPARHHAHAVIGADPLHEG